jgi:hypothetical protein
MTDGTEEIARARDALTTPAAVPDREVLGAVRTGLLLVPADAPSGRVPGGLADGHDAPRLAVRRTRVV